MPYKKKTVRKKATAKKPVTKLGGHYTYKKSGVKYILAYSKAGSGKSTVKVVGKLDLNRTLKSLKARNYKKVAASNIVLKR